MISGEKPKAKSMDREKKDQLDLRRRSLNTCAIERTAEDRSAVTCKLGDKQMTSLRRIDNASHRLALAAAAVAATTLVAGPASAQAYPTRPIKLIVPFPAGGGPT